jgi:hypothetical protein
VRKEQSGREGREVRTVSKEKKTSGTAKHLLDDAGSAVNVTIAVKPDLPTLPSVPKNTLMMLPVDVIAEGRALPQTREGTAPGSVITSR